MARRLVATLLTAFTALGVMVTPAQAAGFTGAVKLDNCSGSLVRLPGSTSSDQALVLTNGHCVELMKPGTALADVPANRDFTLLNGSGGPLAKLQSTEIVYATMTGTDAALYRLDQTYRQLQQKHGARALDLSASGPAAGSGIRIVSGYWTKIYSCRVDAVVHQVREAKWTWNDSLRYTPYCDTIGGTSGSPIIDAASGKVVGVNNTGNESGGRCTMNNPCEVDATGEITVHKGISYGQQTAGLVACFGRGSTLDLTLPGCTVVKPQ
ncbi:serine protease [Lentzea sp. NBRC 102530]|uniref:S1 family peptidase n=1 Tax=Lentzea sp. NBRC 102530 TaxID=3032201 RepID=UPI002556B66F|nr:serine protease [Lentzea sp. NBRC 102530]